MASRPKGFGMTAELAEKNAKKYDKELAQSVMAWVQSQINDGEQAAKIDVYNGDADVVHQTLKDGVILGHLANDLGIAKIKINNSKMAFKMMENISNFLTACENKGVQKNDLFQTVDLYEKTNMSQVVNGILALGRKMGTFGPKEAQANKREFTDEQMRAGQNVIGLQMGSNKGASQAGQSFGKSRSILD